MFENGVAAWLLHLLYIDEIASVYRRSQGVRICAWYRVFALFYAVSNRWVKGLPRMALKSRQKVVIMAF